MKSIDRLHSLSTRHWNKEEASMKALSSIQNFPIIYDKDINLNYNTAINWDSLFNNWLEKEIISIESGNPYVSE